MKQQEIERIQKLWGPFWEPLNTTYERTLAGCKMWQGEERDDGP